VNNGVLLWAALAAVVVGASMLVAGWTRRRQALVLAGTVCSALGAMAAVSGWLLVADRAAGMAEALKTGGLAGGAVVALYGLWLNDRRRRVEEERQRVESGRAEHDRERVAHERFARAVELLGHEADQVRVGALHALVGLARGTPSYTQTVLDVLCSYLRRPFYHPRYREARDPDRADLDRADLDRADLPGALPGWPAERIAEADRERQVRITAQRLISELLPAAGAGDQPLYDLDLSAATVEYLDLSGRRVGGILARRAALYGITQLVGVEFHGRAMFTWSTFFGKTDLEGATFAGGASLLEVVFEESVDLSGCTFRGFANLRAEYPPSAVITGITVDTSADVRLPDGWDVEIRPGSAIGDVTVAPESVS
jgi:hypothetical protein